MERPPKDLSIINNLWIRLGKSIKFQTWTDIQFLTLLVLCILYMYPAYIVKIN